MIRVVNEPVVLTGASRTDAGVHAHGQVAAFTTTRDIPPHKLPRAITARCPADIQVHAAEVVPDHFDPISHAVDKQYGYHMQHGPVLPPLFDRRTTWRTHHRLDPVPMRVAAGLLVGRHDFAAFAQASHGRGSTVREIFHCDVHETGEDRLKMEVRGSGFLYNMVRIIAGTLVEVGRGAFQPECITSAIESRQSTCLRAHPRTTGSLSRVDSPRSSRMKTEGHGNDKPEEESPMSGVLTLPAHWPQVPHLPAHLPT